jgi:hypothetical protein
VTVWSDPDSDTEKEVVLVVAFRDTLAGALAARRSAPRRGRISDAVRRIDQRAYGPETTATVTVLV